MDITINETPKRTSKNFNINNIKIDENIIPEHVSEFSNVIIKGANAKITNQIENEKLIYGLGNILEKQQENQKIKIELDNNKNEETIIEFKFDEKNNKLVDNIQIEAEKNAKATVIIKYNCENVEAYHNGKIILHANEGAQVSIIVINSFNKNSNNFLSMQNKIEETATINYCIIDMGSMHSIQNYYSEIEGKEATNLVKGIYLGKDSELLDLNYLAELKGEKSNIDIDIQGALKDNAKKHFKGTIDFKKGCKKSVGSENENCMLLSDTAKSISLPMLLCSEEDVDGVHSSSCGKIEEKELFYIMTRGFSKQEAIKLMVRAKFNNIIESIKNEELKNEILNQIDKRLD